LEDLFPLESFKTENAFSINLIKNMSAEKRLERDNLTKINNQEHQLVQWDLKFEETNRKNM